MSGRDPVSGTRRSYESIAERYLARTRDRGSISRRAAHFAGMLPDGARVADVGSGPGFDSALLRDQGLQAVALDGSMAMLRVGERDFPGARIQGDLRALPLATACLDGLWANATLLHLPREQLPRALAEARRVLAARGLLYLSVKQGEGARWVQGVDAPGQERFFTYWRDGDLDGELDRAGFEVVYRDTEAGRRDTWLVRLARSPGAGSGP